MPLSPSVLPTRSRTARCAGASEPWLDIPARLTPMVDRRVLVCGAGLMGHGIAQVMAAAGHRVSIYEPEVARAEAGRARIGANLERSVAKGRITEDDRHTQL